jgi:hypothetical protein
VVDLTPFSSFTQMRRADIYKFVGNDPRSVQSIEEFQRLLSGNIPSIFSAILGTSVIAGTGLTGGGALGDGDVTLNVGAGTGIIVGDDTVGIADTTVTAGTYGDATHVPQVTFNAQGQATGATAVALHLPNTVTFQASGGAAPGTSFDGSSHVVVDYSTLGAAPAGSYLTSNQTITISGDGSGSGATAITLTLAATGVTAGTYTNATVAVDSKGRVTSASSGATPLVASNSLSDVGSVSTARTNLGLLRIVPFFFTTTPASSEVMAIYVAVDAFTIPANMSGSQVKVGTNPAATFAMDVQQNGTSIGTISISTGGTPTFTTTSGTAKSIAAGDVLKFVAPSTADTTIANVAVNIKGTL